MRRIEGPFVPVGLGLAGLLPFWALALSLILRPVGATSDWLPPHVVAGALATYGATILSFLGGIRWGLALSPTAARSPTTFAASVMPQLAGWAALAAPDPWRLALLGILHLGLGPLDAALIRGGGGPAWFARLRIVLSVGAGAALLLGAVSRGG